MSCQYGRYSGTGRVERLAFEVSVTCFDGGGVGSGTLGGKTKYTDSQPDTLYGVCSSQSSKQKSTN